ncbi:MAG: ABC transporter ATP-binding protein [Nitrososphaerota archaeon]|nr:ABC transporter ATP-binding protein [Nitrososphaerota archaeon]
MLKVDNVSSGYGRLQILSDVSLEARPGEVTVVVGPNGSGKSTLLKTIAGLTRIYNGTVTLDEKEVSGLPPHEIVRRGIAYLPQTESTFAQLTVAENFRMAAYTVKQSDYPRRLEEALGRFPRLSEYMGTKVQNLSGGERQMVAMSMAMMRRPTAVLFDEPTANLSPKFATQVLDTVSSLAKDSKMIVVLVEQNAKKALEVGDRAYLLVSGRNAFQGSAKELLSHAELAKMYLGLRAA